MADFGDFGTVKAWTATRSREKVALFAARAALRELPRIINTESWPKVHNDLRVFRHVITSVARSRFTLNSKFSDRFIEAPLRTAVSPAVFAADPAYEPGDAATASATSAYIAATVSDDEMAAAHAANAAVHAAFAASHVAQARDSTKAAALADSQYLEDVGVSVVALQPIWRGDAPAQVNKDWENWRKVRMEEPKVWGFWANWYEDMLSGGKLIFELCRDVALIDDAVWKEGPEAVALEIERLRGGGNARLDEEVIKASVERLIAHPTSTMLMVGGAAEQIDNAITQFLNTSGLNSLPSSLAPLYSVSGALKSIATLAQDDQQIDALEAEIDGLVRQMNVLRSELNALKAASLKMGRSSRMIDTALGVAVGVLVTGGIGEAGRIFSYVTGYENSVEIIEDIAQSVSEPEVIVNSLPQIGKD